MSFQYLDSFARAGVLLGDIVVDLATAAPLVFEQADSVRWELLDMLRGTPEGMGLEAAVEIVDAVLEQLGMEAFVAEGEYGGAFVNPSGPVSIGGAEMLLPLHEIRLLAPLPRPASLRRFNTFESQSTAVFRRANLPLPLRWYEEPDFTFGNHQAIYGPGASVPLPQTHELDYELQIACVIGRACRAIAAEDATEYIAGYTILNGWVARDYERDALHGGFGSARARDFAVSLGPWLVTADELDPAQLPDGRHALQMSARVNGIERSRANARDMYATFGELVACASRDTILYPGDVIASGGAGSLLLSTNGAGPWLTEDDSVELEITGLGALRNTIA